MIAEPTPGAALTPRAQAVANRIDAAVIWFATHWLAVFICYGATVIGLAALAPLLRGTGHQTAASLIYIPYRLICHQRDDRSFHLYGEQMAFCERDAAIVSTAVLVGLAFGIVRRTTTLAPIPFGVVVLFALPMAIDGGTQLLGLRESTPGLRLLTGALFSIGAGWFVLPYLEAGFESVRDDIRARRLAQRTDTAGAA